jgi:hypothetical protein
MPILVVNHQSRKRILNPENFLIAFYMHGRVKDNRLCFGNSRWVLSWNGLISLKLIKRIQADSEHSELALTPGWTRKDGI